MKYYIFVVGVAYGGADDVLGTGVLCMRVCSCVHARARVIDKHEIKRGLSVCAIVLQFYKSYSSNLPYSGGNEAAVVQNGT